MIMGCWDARIIHRPTFEEFRLLNFSSLPKPKNDEIFEKELEELTKSGSDLSISDVQVGQKVRYHPVGGGMQLTEGIIKEIVTHPEVVGDTQKRVKASKEEPRIVIENLNTHKETAYKLENIEEILK
ncbi:hypothetical protein Glove_115g8 [Diversispora epigaea]|uniref:Hypervirulence associated protein TUDOR domain-containing protein n=1 Tax=Diversispora epigaea TaxID=1348612 RepID=A0A397J3L2_9GLOM|nr:hypothetical protein Glove_115g8 [Diversispora epigaea]